VKQARRFVKRAAPNTIRIVIRALYENVSLPLAGIDLD